MSKIPYCFETPIPKYFKENGWFKPRSDGHHLKVFAFISWCFSRCSTVKRKVYHDHKEIFLEEFEFIFGRRICSDETGLTEQEIRTLINQLFSTPNGPLLKKSTNSVTNRFTCYKWSTDVFCENINQLNNQPVTNRQPTGNHNLEERIKNKEEQYISREALEKKSNFLIEDEFLTNGQKVVGCDFIFDNKNLENRTLEQELDITYIISPTNSVENETKQNKTEEKPNKSKQKKSKSKVHSEEYKQSLIERRKNIHTSEEEHAKLVQKLGIELTEKCYEELSEWKTSKSLNNPKSVDAHSDNYRILKWVIEAVKQKEINQPIQANSVEDNKKFAQQVANSFFNENYKIEILSKTIEFTPQRGQAPPDIINFSDKGFRDQIKNVLTKRQFKERKNISKNVV